MKHFAGRVALVTGGASGIGYGLVRNFLEQGMKVVVVDWNAAHLAEVQRELAQARDVHFVRADVGDRAEVRALAAEAVRVFGKIHVLCNNAGVSGGGNAEDPDFEAWDRALRVNFGGVVNGVKIIAPLILSHGEGGHIVNTSSMAGIVPLPLPGLGAYMTSKFAVRGFTESLRLSLAPHGIGVSCLCPGGTRSRIMDIREGASESQREMVETLLTSSMDPMELGARVVEAIRLNAPYILSHAEFREEVAEIGAALVAAFPRAQQVPPGRKAFEDHRRTLAAQLRALPVKD
jgi:NAD(P)-dependent dehydrogenase (short-subunit alcohol dehydrogenase family)